MREVYISLDHGGCFVSSLDARREEAIVLCFPWLDCVSVERDSRDGTRLRLVLFSIGSMDHYSIHSGIYLESIIRYFGIARKNFVVRMDVVQFHYGGMPAHLIV